MTKRHCKNLSISRFVIATVLSFLPLVADDTSTPGANHKFAWGKKPPGSNLVVAFLCCGFSLRAHKFSSFYVLSALKIKVSPKSVIDICGTARNLHWTKVACVVLFYAFWYFYDVITFSERKIACVHSCVWDRMDAEAQSQPLIAGRPPANAPAQR